MATRRHAEGSGPPAHVVIAWAGVSRPESGPCGIPNLSTQALAESARSAGEGLRSHVRHAAGQMLIVPGGARRKLSMRPRDLAAGLALACTSLVATAVVSGDGSVASRVLTAVPDVFVPPATEATGPVVPGMTSAVIPFAPAPPPAGASLTAPTAQSTVGLPVGTSVQGVGGPTAGPAGAAAPGGQAVPQDVAPAPDAPGSSGAQGSGGQGAPAPDSPEPGNPGTGSPGAGGGSGEAPERPPPAGQPGDDDVARNPLAPVVTPVVEVVEPVVDRLGIQARTPVRALLAPVDPVLETAAEPVAPAVRSLTEPVATVTEPVTDTLVPVTEATDPALSLIDTPLFG